MSRTLHAGYLQIYLQIILDRALEGIAFLSAAAQSISVWDRNNYQRLNASKIKAIVFVTHHAFNYIKSMNLPGILLGNGETTPFVDKNMSLGVVVKSTLSWRSHINQ